MTAIAHHPHQVSRAVADARTSLEDVSASPLYSLDPAETAAAIEQVGALAAQVAELQARLLAHAHRSDLAVATAQKSTAHWLAHATRASGVLARRTMRLAEALDDHDLTRAALAEGRLHVEQAEVILRALAELPDDLDRELLAKAEAHLIDEAQHHDAKALRVLGRRILELLDPEAADAHEAMLLEREERDALAATRLTMWEDDRGRLQGRFTLPPLEGAMFKKMVLAVAAPKHRAFQGPLGERKPSPERLGHAFCELIGTYPTKKLPQTGGLNATVVVTMTLDSLMGGLEAARLDTGGAISASLARKLACEAGIIPAVLGGQSQVLDLGRTRRFYSEAQRIAKGIEAGGCQVEGCDTPPGMTHLHHPVRWADGGETNRDGIMVCPWHHHRAHDHRYRLVAEPAGKVSFHRRT
jgi:hypothetical protein